MLYGYARVSTGGQSLGLGDQLAALVRAGVPESAIVTEVASGAAARPLLEGLVAGSARGDEIVVARLDRLGRSMTQLAALVSDLDARGVGVRSLADGLDSRSTGGRLLLHILAAAAQYERELLSERTRAALGEARRRGVRLGRPRKLGPLEVRAIIAQLDAGLSVASAARAHHVSQSTLWTALRDVGWRRGEEK